MGGNGQGSNGGTRRPANARRPPLRSAVEGPSGSAENTVAKVTNQVEKK
jgi:hypothetical protein